jgi:trk system potassium uptake protein TrkA
MMRVVICGAGTTGRHVAEVLAALHHVTLIDVDPHRIGASGPNLAYVLGDASDPDVLLAAGGSAADALIAVTRDDPVNLVAATLARHRLGARWVVARMNDPGHAWLFGPEAGVDVVVSTAQLVARLVQEEVTAGDLVTLLRLRGAGIAVTETTLPPGASAAGTPAGEVALPEGTALTAVVRGGHLLLPDRAGRLSAGDVVMALCEPGMEHLLHDTLVGEAGQ